MLAWQRFLNLRWLCALQVVTMRSQFGFIKCCERPGEMFFHFSALQGGPEAFAVGNDVEFSVTREPKGERLNAVEYAVLFTIPAPVLIAALIWSSHQWCHFPALAVNSSRCTSLTLGCCACIAPVVCSFK